MTSIDHGAVPGVAARPSWRTCRFSGLRIEANAEALIKVNAVAAVLFLPGVLVYLILRPPQTLEEEFERTLEEEALLQSIEDNALCPGCGRRVREDWVACPNCHTRLKKPCHQCGKLNELAWNLCPYCGTPAPGMRREGPPAAWSRSTLH